MWKEPWVPLSPYPPYHTTGPGNRSSGPPPTGQSRSHSSRSNDALSWIYLRSVFPSQPHGDRPPVPGGESPSLTRGE